MKNWYVLLLFLLSCGNNNVSSTEEWSINENPSRSSTEIEIDPNNEKPLVFSPGVFEWQPVGLAVVVHTGVNAKKDYPDPNNEAIEVQKISGLRVRFSISEKNKSDLHLDKEEVTWIGFDIEKMNVQNAIHFFEVYSKEPPTGNSTNRGPFNWLTGDDIWVKTNHHTLIEAYIPSASGRTTSYYEGQKADVSLYWSNYIDQVISNGDTGELYIWKPEAGSIVKKPVRISYSQSSSFPRMHYLTIEVI